MKAIYYGDLVVSIHTLLYNCYRHRHLGDNCGWNMGKRTLDSGLVINETPHLHVGQQRFLIQAQNLKVTR